jgi:hypothetical protein
MHGGCIDGIVEPALATIWATIAASDMHGHSLAPLLRADRFEMKNVIGQADARPALEEMQAEMHRLLRTTT